MDTIKECFNEILKSDKEASRLAARRVRKLLYSSQGGSDKYGIIKSIINAAPAEYEKIAEDWRQENLVLAVSDIYFLHDREAQPDFLFPWLLQLLQHANGYIRYAAVRMISNEIGPLTVHIRHNGQEPNFFGNLAPEQADSILFSLFASLHALSAALWLPRYKKYKYIDSLPASPYKSVQMVLAEMEESCGQEYTNRLAARNYTI